MRRKQILMGGTLLAVLSLVAGSSWAYEEPQGVARRGPPPEAIEACKDKSEGTAVEITTPRGDTIKAICKQIDGQIAAVPEGGFRGPKRTPPGVTQGGE